MIAAKAPSRIDLAGGTLDIYPLYLFLNGGLTINMAIDLYGETVLSPRSDDQVILKSKDLKVTEAFNSISELSVNHKLEAAARVVNYFAPIGGLEVTTNSLAPKGSGLGGSSSLIVSLIAALAQYTYNWPLREEYLLSLARDIEASMLGIPAGTQDYEAALHGGINALRFDVGGRKREEINISHNFLDLLETQIVLCFTGVSRFSGRSNWEIFRNLVDGDIKTRELLRKSKDIAEIILDALLEDNFPGFSQAIKQEAKIREQLYGNINIKAVKSVVEICQANGVTTYKPCGAGGGGCYILLASSSQQAELLRENLKKTSFVELPFNIARDGLKVHSY
ncbi:MAG: hypothetical protein ACE5OZ_17700 [Candidatus Heimdallarchaeota archaeon]